MTERPQIGQMSELPSVFELSRNFLKDRPVIAEHDTPERVLQLLIGEVNELIENPSDPLEAADVMIYVMVYLESLGYDPETAIRNKIGLNSARYTAKDFQAGDFREIYVREKAFSQQIGIYPDE